MSIQENLHRDLVFAIKEKNEEKKSAIRVALAELQRKKEKEIPDADAVKTIKNLVDAQEEMGVKKDISFINILSAYLPEPASEEEIENWIRTRIEFSDYKHPIQAMRIVLAAFEGRADGNQIKDILMKVAQEQQ
jgi:uncharacterized protein YqeY